MRSGAAHYSTRGRATIGAASLLHRVQVADLIAAVVLSMGCIIVVAFRLVVGAFSGVGTGWLLQLNSLPSLPRGERESALYIFTLVSFAAGLNLVSVAEYSTAVQ